MLYENSVGSGYCGVEEEKHRAQRPQIQAKGEKEELGTAVRPGWFLLGPRLGAAAV